MEKELELQKIAARLPEAAKNSIRELLEMGEHRSRGRSFFLFRRPCAGVSAMETHKIVMEALNTKGVEKE
jgi:hypothetical protein